MKVVLLCGEPGIRLHEETEFRQKPMVEIVSRPILMAFDYLARNGCTLKCAPIECLAHEGDLMDYKHDGFFLAMDTYRKDESLNQLRNKGEVAWKVC